MSMDSSAASCQQLVTQLQGVLAYNTADNGAVSFVVTADGVLGPVKSVRKENEH